MEHQYEGFKLLSLRVIDNHILGTNTFSFVDEKDQPDSIYFSVLIGSNGTGKSEILGLILTLFRNICRLEQKIGALRISGWYELTYSSFGNIYSFTNFPTEWREEKILWGVPDSRAKPYLLENEGAEKYATFENASATLPASIVANSIMLTDKYFVPRNEKDKQSFPMYHYLGVRNRPQQASTSSYVRKTVEFIVDQIDSDAFNSGIRRITKFLGGERSVHVLFYTVYTTKFYHGSLNKSHLDAYFDPILEKYNAPDKTAPFKATHYEKMRMDEEYIEELCEFLNSLFEDERLEQIYRSSVKIVRYDIGNNDSHAHLKKEYKYLNDLRKLGIIHAPEVTFVDDKEVYLQHSSSGEFHFFSTMVGLMASIKPNTLILIDEPEISLHPNWQMQYLGFLRELFSSEEYKSCQVIIATHSHFLISDLRGTSSKIIGLKKNSDNKIQTIEMSDLDTFGWSAEEVLYKVFNVKSTRNSYLELELRELLHGISTKQGDKQKMKEILDRVNSLSLSELDPLNLIVERARNYLND